MLSNNTGVVIPKEAVTYKFKVKEFAELFESLSAEQNHIALEGALNIIFTGAKGKSLLQTEEQEEQTEEDDQVDHESQIVSSSTFALHAHNRQEGDLDDTETPVSDDDVENDPEYLQLEETFRGIVDYFSQAIAEDKYNQDIITLYGEMQFFNHIELFTYHYDTKHEVLSVTVISTNTEE